MRDSIAVRTVLALIAALVLTAATPASARAVGDGTGCQAAGVWGACFETLPKLHCCSAAFLGWSEILVGDSFPVSGRLFQGEPRGNAAALRITFPSGRSVTLPAGEDGRFMQEVTFDEEGNYSLARVTAEGEVQLGSFQVGYRAEFVDLPTAEALFGSHAGRPFGSFGVTMGAVAEGESTTLRIRFTDAAGEPVRSRTLALKLGGQTVTTDEDGVATLAYTADGMEVGYTIDRLYPGLAVLSYRTVTVDEQGLVQGLPGGEVNGFIQEGRTYLPLREFLEKAAPLRLGDLPERIVWNETTRTVEVEGLRIMTDTGMVLGPSDFRADLQMREGRTYLELGSMVRLLDQLGMASPAGPNSFRLTLADLP